MKTRQDIEATSNLIAAAKLLGGKYSKNRIDLPCGRHVEFQKYTGCEDFILIKTSWISPYQEDFRRERSPEYIARRIRALVVEDDKNN